MAQDARAQRFLQPCPAGLARVAGPGAERHEAALDPTMARFIGADLCHGPVGSARVPGIPDPKYVEPGRQFPVSGGGRAGSAFVPDARGVPAFIRAVLRTLRC
ncbi:hypothetical protein GCM10009578_051310 [Streptomyces rhizosphaericus]